MKLFKKVLTIVFNIYDKLSYIILVLAPIVIVWLVFAEVFKNNLCSDISTCYAIVIFLAGTIITLKIRILDGQKKLIELIIFIIGLLVNIVFITVSFSLDSASETEKAILVLNATIWADSLIVFRNLYMLIELFFRQYYRAWKDNKKHETEIVNDRKDLFELWLEKKDENNLVRRALTDKSCQKVNNELKATDTNCELAVYGNSIIRMCLSGTLLNKTDKLTQAIIKYESDEYLVKHVASRYNLIPFIDKDKNDTKMPSDYNYLVKKGNNPHKYIATAVEAMIGAIYIETRNIDAITELISSWKEFGNHNAFSNK